MGTSSTLVIPPDQYQSIPAYDLLSAAARGYVGIDHRFLHALADHPERTLDDMLRFAMEQREDDPVNLEEELLSVFRYLKTPRAIDFYLELLRRYEGEMPDDLLAAFHQLGADIIAPLVALYGELGEEAGSEIPFLLASLGIRDERILPVLVDHLEYDATDGALCLGLYGEPAGKEALEKLLAELEDEDPTQAALKRQVAEALEQLGKPAQREEMPPFDLFEEYPEVAGPSFFAMSESDRLSFFSSTSAEYRAEAAESFFNEDISDRAYQSLLKLAETDPDANVRGRAWESLSGSVDDRPELRKKMLSVLRNPETPKTERAGLLVGLSNEAGSKEVRPHTLALYEDPETRAKALQAMWRSFDRSFSEFFPKNLDSSDPEIQRHAIWGCGYLNITSVLGRLRSFFESEDLRADALFAYALCAPSDVTPARMRALLEKIEREANGLSGGEVELVETALDQRLMMHGKEPIFNVEEDEDEGDEGHEHVHGPNCHHDHDHQHDSPKTVSIASGGGKIGRNDPCPCGSGKKYKKCHGAADS